MTNPNCTSTGLTVALKALDDVFGVKKVFVVSLQALSGAGYPGVASLDIIDNVIPNIQGEEEKVEWEPRKMLGKLSNHRIETAEICFSAHTNRVAVSDGHLICLSAELGSPVDPEVAEAAPTAFQGQTRQEARMQSARLLGSGMRSILPVSAGRCRRIRTLTYCGPPGNWHNAL